MIESKLVFINAPHQANVELEQIKFRDLLMIYSVSKWFNSKELLTKYIGKGISAKSLFE
jgi:hypothetical protein